MNQPMCVVGVVIFNSAGQILLDKRENNPGLGAWAIPGGHVKWGESLLNAAKREVREETGLEIDLSRQLRTYEIIDKTAHLILTLFQATVTEGRLTSGEWFSPEAITELNIHERGREIIADVLAFPVPMLHNTQKKLESVPRHVGLIPDGTRRWSRINHVPLAEGYYLAMDKISEFIETMFEIDVNCITIYLLSRQNLDRSSADLNAVDEAEAHLITNLLTPLSSRLAFNIVVCGDYDKTPERLKWAIDALDTADFSRKRTINLLIAYDPIEELRATKGQDVNDFWVCEPLDLVIRTSGERRISNFVPLQCGYAEFAFVTKHLNDLQKRDWMAILADYSMRQRRFGR